MYYKKWEGREEEVLGTRRKVVPRVSIQEVGREEKQARWEESDDGSDEEGGFHSTAPRRPTLNSGFPVKN